MELVYILTYNCNFRCTYCDINKNNISISKEITEQSLKFVEKNKFNIKKIKFFGWEPLLKKNSIKYIVENFPLIDTPLYYITTNSILVDKIFFNYCKKNNIYLTFSIDWNISTLSKNRILENWWNLSKTIINKTKKYSDFIRVNQVIISQNSKDFFSNFKYIYDLWVRKFNFLPAYYIEWSKEWLKNLKEWFNQIFDFYREWNSFELVNLENYSDISFFNLWLIIDTDWSVYWSNLILSKKFEKYKKDLLIWDVFSWLKYDIFDLSFKKDYIEKLWKIIKKEYSENVLKSVKYIDLILNNFCNEYKNKNISPK